MTLKAEKEFLQNQIIELMQLLELIEVALQDDSVNLDLRNQIRKYIGMDEITNSAEQYYNETFKVKCNDSSFLNQFIKSQKM